MVKKFKCQCGSDVSVNRRKQHEKTKKHTLWLKKYNTPDPIEQKNISNIDNNDGYDKNVDDLLSDQQLWSMYEKQPSFCKKVEKTRDDLLNAGFDKDQVSLILKVISPLLVPPGTKGVVRGNAFNQIVKENLTKSFHPDTYKLTFEVKHTIHQTTETPDFIVYNITNGRSVIGFNQRDLWGGGAQINRASKYIDSEEFHSTPDNVKILSVVCSNLSECKGKKRYIYDRGINTQRMCYIGKMSEIIHKFLDVEKMNLSLYKQEKNVNWIITEDNRRIFHQY